MANIGIIMVSYRADPTPLFRSLLCSRHSIRWYIYGHGTALSLNARLQEIAKTVDARFFPFGVNRGLSRSWNEGLKASLADDNEVTIIINDDLFFYDDGFDQFVEFILTQSRDVSDFGIATLYGMETGTGGAIGSGENFQKPTWQGGACFAVGSGAIQTIGYFDQNFWPAYYEDMDYFRRLRLASLPMLVDQRTLLEHNRSYTLRTDLSLRRLNGERFARNEAYYAQKWGGPLGAETFSQPFGNASFSCLIPPERVDAPYGPGYDRDDLGSAASLGLLEANLAEEAIAQLDRHAGGARRFLEWGAGETTAIVADFARQQGAELFLSIDHRTEEIQHVAAQVPKYPFLHFRCIDAKAGSGSDGASEYSTYPLILGSGFDVILIAGTRRMECMVVARTALAPGGIVMLRDWREGGCGCAIRRLFDVVAEGRQLLVLRAKQ